MAEYHFIVNPNARSKKGIAIWKKLKEYLTESQIDYNEYLTMAPDHARKLAKQLSALDRPIILIVLGGDGTLNEVINGITHFKNITLAYIPIGSSNDFARALHLSKDPFTSLQTILTPTTYCKLDYGTVTFGDGLTHVRRFLISGGLGFDAGVCYETNSSPLKKILNHLHLGKLTYGLIAIKQLAMTPYAKGSLVLDNEKKIKLNRLFFLSVHNTCFEGGGFMFCPNATPFDHKLDICIADRLPRLFTPFLIPMALKGWHTKSKYISTYQFNQAVLSVETPLYLHTDGETCLMPSSGSKDTQLKHTKAMFSISKEQIPFILN